MKNSTAGWTALPAAAIVWGLSFCTALLSAAQEPPAAGAEAVQQELRLAREAAEKRVVALQASLDKANRDLEQLRSRYAELYLRSQERLQQWEALELQAAHLLVDRQALAGGDPAAPALHALEDVRQAQVQLVGQVRAFQTYLSSVLDVLEPSETMRREITQRGSELAAAAERALKPLSTVAGRGRRDLVARTCRVLAVHDDLQMVVLDGGMDAGVGRGSQWTALKDGVVKARLQVIEVRTDLSAAMVTAGDFRALGVGAEVTAD